MVEEKDRVVRRRTRLSSATSLLLIVLLVATGMSPCFSTAEYSDIGGADSPSQDSSTRDYWPTEGWRNSTPQEHGMNNATLYDMVRFIEDQDYPVYSIVIVKDGYIVFEQYLREYYPMQARHLLHSVTKSFAGTLIGIAIQQGLLSSVNATVLDFFPEYEVANPDPRKDRMTIEDLLTMTTGFEWDEWSTPYVDPDTNTLMGLMYSRDAVEFVLDRPMAHEPGTTWAYCGGASVLLGAIVQQVSGNSTLSFAQQYLFDPLGFGPVHWYLVPGGWCNAHGGLMLRTQDIARLGFLYLNNGSWDGVQILPADFVANVTTPIDIPNGIGGPFGYGWHWWTRSDLGIYFAYGRHGQKIMVSPEHDMVVAFNAMIPDDGYDPEFDLFRDYVLKSIEDGPDSSPTNSVTVFPDVAGVVAIVTVMSLAGAVTYMSVGRRTRVTDCCASNVNRTKATK